MRHLDPPAVPQLAIPVAVQKRILANVLHLGTPLALAIGNLLIIAFFFLLRIGEYTRAPIDPRTKKQKNNAKRTVQFHIGDIGFFKNGHILPRKSKLSMLLTADEVTLKITNQKNGTMGQVIHQQATGNSTDCPVQAVAHRVHHILSNGGSSSNCICDYLKKSNVWRDVQPADI
jgi:hypothetical protein